MTVISATEQHHHTSEQIRGYIEEAVAIVTEAELADDLQEPVLLKVIDLLAAKQIFYEQMQPSMAIPGRRLHG